MLYIRLCTYTRTCTYLGTYSPERMTRQMRSDCRSASRSLQAGVIGDGGCEEKGKASLGSYMMTNDVLLGNIPPHPTVIQRPSSSFKDALSPFLASNTPPEGTSTIFCSLKQTTNLCWKRLLELWAYFTCCQSQHGHQDGS
jgi:hypothetical protein